MTTTTYNPQALHMLIDEDALSNRLDALAEELNERYKDTQCLVLICILKGGFMFLAELSKRLTVPCQIEFVRLSSYGNAQKSSGVVKPVDLTLPRLQGKDILVIEDIVDTGLTLNFLMEYIESVHSPDSLQLAVLLDKKEARQHPVQTDYVGFEIEDKYVVGFGLDSQGLYRNLPYIGYFE